jgi:predicted site-specific integrase-resolvase
MVGISRATLYNWLRDQKIKEVARDRNSFRIFTEEDVQRILAYKNMVKHPL